MIRFLSEIHNFFFFFFLPCHRSSSTCGQDGPAPSLLAQPPAAGGLGKKQPGGMPASSLAGCSFIYFLCVLICPLLFFHSTQSTHRLSLRRWLINMTKLFGRLMWPKASQNQIFKRSHSLLMVKMKIWCWAAADWKGRNQSFSGVTVWPGSCACCWASALCCWRQCWGQGETPVGGASFSGSNMHPVAQLEVSLCFRFSGGETLLWMHSLFFSLVSCIFLIQPAVVHLGFLLYRICQNQTDFNCFPPCSSGGVCGRGCFILALEESRFFQLLMQKPT